MANLSDGVPITTALPIPLVQITSTTPASVSSGNSVHSFTGLTTGRVYRLETVLSSSTAATVQLREDSTELTTIYGTSGNSPYVGSTVFVASGTTADVFLVGGTLNRVGGSFRSCLTELNGTVTTTF